MKIRITEGQAKYFEDSERRFLGIESWQMRADGACLIDLRERSDEDCKKILLVLTKHVNVRGVSKLVEDVKIWTTTVENADQKVCTSVRSMEQLLIQAMIASPRIHLYSKKESLDDTWEPWFVSEVGYTPRRGRGEDMVEEHTTVELQCIRYDGVYARNLTFWPSCISDKLTVAEHLRERGYVFETKELRERYEVDFKAWLEVRKDIGGQYLATGQAWTIKGRGWDDRAREISMTRDGEESKVVVDEDLEEGKGTDHSRAGRFWIQKATRLTDEQREEGLSPQEVAEKRSYEIPYRHYVKVFDLRRHMNLNLHISQMTKYVYNTQLKKQLVLSEDVKQLVDVLVEHKDGGFEDVVKGKSGGAIVLLCGAPGTGKTLTAEVFSESEKKPLYSVQASQLGMDAQALENELGIVLRRAKKWDAILLIDEADVYMRKRGEHIGQNAIVGVFLRVLEYYSGVLFLTTNRGDDVDDAISSRCIARIEYEYPIASDLTKIWKILTKKVGAPMADAEIDAVVNEYVGRMSGRDVKNLLKLAVLLNKGKGKDEPITLSTIKQAIKFKPTKTLESGH